MRYKQGLRIGVTDVFGSMDHDASGDKLRVLPRIDHARKPIDGGIGVAAAHGLNERTDNVVVHVTVFVIRKPTARIGDLHIVDRDGIPLPRRRSRRPLGIGTRDGNLARQLKRRQGRACITRCQRANGLDRIIIGREFAVQALRCLERTLDKHGDILIL